MLQRVDDVRIENGKYSLEAKNRAEYLKKSLEDAEILKDELKKNWETEFENLKNYHGVKFDGVLGDIKRLDEDIMRYKNSLNVRHSLILGI